MTVIPPKLEVKRLSLLREVVPGARRIAMLSMHRKVTEPGNAPMRTVAADLNIQVVEFYIDGPDEFQKAFTAMRSAGAEAVDNRARAGILCTGGEPCKFGHSGRLANRLWGVEGG